MRRLLDRARAPVLDAPAALAAACLALTAACGPGAPDAASGGDVASGDSLVAVDSAAARDSAAAGPLELAALEQLWTEQRHGEVLPQLIRYRSTAPYGRNEVVDYMIATSACRVSGQEALGARMFAWILDHYSIDEHSRELVRSEMERCPPATRLVPATMVMAAAGPASAASTRGKMFYDISRGGSVPLANVPVRVTREIPPAQLAARLFAPEQAGQAAASVRQLAGPEYHVLTVGPFTLASRTHSEDAMRAIGTGLARYLDFYAAEFGMPRPPHLVTIYLAANESELLQLADRVHGIGISDMSIGYSFRDDLSMVGIIPQRTYGTLAHELFHLMVRRDFGDVPPWLDEGMAALFEVSTVQPDGSIRGTPNWRGPVLQRFWNLRPAVADLVKADWQGFEAAEDDYEPARQAAIHATARYLVLFLQETDRLVPVYRAFHARDALADSDRQPEDAVATFERAVGRSAAVVDQEFASWFRGLRQ